MKISIRTVILALAALFAALSCQKETASSDAQNQAKAGETIRVSINACLGDLVSADGTKATAESVVRLKWEDTDTVQAYCGSTKISGTKGLAVTPSENGMFASLTGDITPPEEGNTITFVYSSGCTTADGLTFDFSNQADSIPFVAYGTLVYDRNAIENKMVEFKLATSVMKVAATNLGGGEITGATISGINTKVTLAPSGSGEPAITGDKETPSKKISTNIFAASPDGTRAIITVGLVPDNTTSPYRMLAVKQTGYTNKGVITSAEIKGNTSYTTPAALFPCGTLGTGENAHDYVLIAGTKWATQNLAVSSYGKGDWKPGGSSTVKVPGTTDENIKIGDYFQWGTHEGYCGDASDADKGLLIYTSFINTGTEDGNSFTFKTGIGAFSTYDFENGVSPYYDYSKWGYTEYYSPKSCTLVPSDDVASILWGGTWRMPASAEFETMKKVTYWKWDDTDKGYYVFVPQAGDEGKENGENSNTYDNSAALLFFPATGYGYRKEFDGVGSLGYYWSSSLYLSDRNDAYYLLFREGLAVNTQARSSRYSGRSIRPVSD